MIAVIFNPAAGRGRISLETLRERLALGAGPISFRIFSTSAGESAEALAARALSEGAQIVAAAGGDGTLGEVLNAIYGTGAKLGILPTGTGNDFARALGIGTDLELAITTLFGENWRRIDVGRARCQGQSRLFCNIAGCGFDAKVAARLNAGQAHPFWKHWKGVAAYLAATSLELLRLRAARVRLNLDGEILDTRALLCAICNANSYGGGMKVAPDAQLDDGLFDICVVKDASKWEFMRAFPGVFRGAHVSNPNVAMRRARCIEIWCQSAWPVLLDGEIWGQLPLQLEIVPRAIEVMAPCSSIR